MELIKQRTTSPSAIYSHIKLLGQMLTSLDMIDSPLTGAQGVGEALIGLQLPGQHVHTHTHSHFTSAITVLALIRLGQVSAEHFNHDQSLANNSPFVSECVCVCVCVYIHVTIQHCRYFTFASRKCLKYHIYIYIYGLFVCVFVLSFCHSFELI